LAQQNATPSAALHLIELGADDLVGVFRCNVCGWDENEFKVWNLGRSADWFRSEFTKSVLPNIERAGIGAEAAAAKEGSPDKTLSAQYDEGLLNQADDYLYSLVFHTSDGNESEAEMAFRQFVNMELTNRTHEQPPPSLFVRLLPQNEDLDFVVPFQLARVRTSSGDSRYLGFLLRIQSPLEIQDYFSQSDCIDQWVLLVPPATIPVDNPLSMARKEFDTWITAFKNSKTSRVYENLDKFRTDWLNPDKKPTPENDVVLILSHNENNTLHFDPDDAGIAPVMSRRYSTASLVILAACSTAKPKAFEFVREFNLHGASSIIAASVDVNASMGGQFIHILADQMNRDARKQGYTLDRIMFDSVNSLSTVQDGFPNASSAYGARALIFNLVGNGNVHACIPTSKSL
jgi:hypothetical protein